MLVARMILSFVLLVGLLSGTAVAASPSPAPAIAPVISWQRAVLAGTATPFPAGELPVDLAASGRGLVLLTRGADDTVRPWWSPDGLSWAPVDAVAEAGMDLIHVTAAPGALVISGQDADAHPVVWSSPDGTTWHRSTRSELGSMARGRLGDLGPGLLAYGTIDGKRLAWSSQSGRTWRSHGGTLPADPADAINLPIGRNGRLEQLLTGRDGSIAVVRQPDADGLMTFTSRNRWDWTATTGILAIDATTATSAWASDDRLIVQDRTGADGSHALAVSAGGPWLPVASRSERPTGAGTWMVMRYGEVFVATDDGVWQGIWEPDPLDAITPPVIAGAPPLGPIGADPPLRDPVMATGRTLRPSLDRAADAHTRRAGILLELWVPHPAAGPGDRLVAHVRLTNVGDRTLELDCPTFEVRGDVTALYPPGRSWSGHAAELRQDALGSDGGLGTLWFRRLDARGRFCEGGSTGLIVTVRPGDSIDGESGHLVRATLGGQALPGGRLPIASTLRWTPLGTEDQVDLRITADATIRGPAWPWPGPAQVVDAALADPRVADRIERSRGGWVSGGDVERALEFAPSDLLPADVGPHDLLAFEIWVPFSQLGGGFRVLTVLMDPWTAQVLDVRES